MALCAHQVRLTVFYLRPFLVPPKNRIKTTLFVGLRRQTLSFGIGPSVRIGIDCDECISYLRVFFLGAPATSGQKEVQLRS